MFQPFQCFGGECRTVAHDAVPGNESFRNRKISKGGAEENDAAKVLFLKRSQIQRPGKGKGDWPGFAGITFGDGGQHGLLVDGDLDLVFQDSAG